MVMENPSSQSVGREFVRQYYTLMNEAPDYLHRFYSSTSSFIHSGVDRPGQEAEAVHGQKAIHQKIKELNFEDCHTKIRQVDSQATVGDGVVVQVTGELSNRGGPMRRFMQTFVLAHQTPKQYYVNNDIFRYQDEVFQDSYESEEEAEVHSANVETVVENGLKTDIIDIGVDHQDEQGGAADAADCATPPQQKYVDDSETSMLAEHSVGTVTPPADKLNLSAVDQTEEDQITKTEDLKADIEMPASAMESHSANDKPAKFHSWANVAAGSGSAAVAVVPPMSTSTGSNKQSALPLATIAAQQKEDEENLVPFSMAQEEPTPQQAVKAPRASVEPTTKPPRHDLPSDRTDRRTNERFPDTHQVFVGNLPVDIADLQLKRFFNTYGKVVDIRINRGGASGKVPFGFVVFESSEPVNKLLQLKRVEMDGHRLNVEEKKARNDRAGSNSRAPRGPRTGQRTSSRPKDRENSGSRSESKPSQHSRKFVRS